MERLTTKLDLGLHEWEQITFKNPNDLEGMYNIADVMEHCKREDGEWARLVLIKLIERFAEYESLGLSPAQLLEVDKQYGELAAEYGRVKRELEEYRKADDKLGALSITEFVDVTIKYIGEKEIGKIGKYELLTNEHVEKWEEYKKLDQDGRLIKLPHKVGDTVYFPSMFKTGIISGVIREIIIQKQGVTYIVLLSPDNAITRRIEAEKTFLTREAAEAKLAEMEGSNGTD